MDRMPRYIPARDRIVRIDRRRGAALFAYVEKLAYSGDQRAGAFLDALLAGCFDEPPPDDVRDSGIRTPARPNTVRPGEP
jgi:hypothetical protein